MIPQVQGRYFFNLDVMIAWLRHRDEDVGRLFVNYQRIYGNTFNTRVLGDNQILSVDPAVFDYAMSARFEEFEKGMYVVELKSSKCRLNLRREIQESSRGFPREWYLQL